MQQDELRKISPDLVAPSRYQARVDFDPHSLEELAESIDSNGLLQPIVVRPQGNMRYELIAGERRLRAVRLLGLSSIDAIVRFDVPELVAASWGLAENIQRDSISPIEEARGYQRLSLEFHLQHDEIASSVGKSRSYVTNYLRLLDLDPKVRDMVHERVISVAHAKTIVGLPLSYHLPLVHLTLRNAWNVRKLEKKVAEIRAELEGRAVGKPAEDDFNPDLTRLECVLGEATGSPVSVSFDPKTRSGVFEIKFCSLDEAQGLIERIVGPDWENRKSS